MKREAGYTFLILMAMVTILAIGLLVAVPVWRTQIQRENEEELIFRGGQYVEAVRVYQTKNPGSYPKSIEELLKGRYLRRPFPDPMTSDGRWDLVLQASSTIEAGSTSSPTPSIQPGEANASGAAPAVQVLVVPWNSLSSIATPRIIGVVSRSPRKSLRILDDNETYDTWIFYYGKVPGGKTEIIRLERPDK